MGDSSSKRGGFSQDSAEPKRTYCSQYCWEPTDLNRPDVSGRRGTFSRKPYPDEKMQPLLQQSMSYDFLSLFAIFGPRLSLPLRLYIFHVYLIKGYC